MPDIDPVVSGILKLMRFGTSKEQLLSMMGRGDFSEAQMTAAASIYHGESGTGEAPKKRGRLGLPRFGGKTHASESARALESKEK